MKHFTRDQIVELVKAAGQELIERADEFVPNGENFTELCLDISFPDDDQPFLIDVDYTHWNQQGIATIKEWHERGEL